MGVASMQGNITLGPTQAGAAFPGTTAIVPLRLLTEPKPFTTAAPVLSVTISNPAYVPLTSVGANGPVVRCNTMHLKCESAIRVRVTFDDGIGGTYQSVIPVQGTLLVETPDAEAIVGLEALADNVVVEYFAAGLS